MAKRYLVAYDLHHQSSTTYDEVGKVIEKFGDTCHFQESVWLVASNSTKKALGSAIDDVAGKQDKVFIVEFSKTYRDGHGQDLEDWLDEHPIPSA